MSVESVKIKDVLVDDSRFALDDFLFEFAPEQTCQINAFDTFGILYPIIVYKDRKGQLHLVDGKKRVQFATLNRDTMIRATILPENTPVTDLITLILCNKRYEIEFSIINKIQFIYFACSLNAPESWVLQSLCIPFEFKPDSDFLRECERVYNLPKELKLFCHEKKFSFKQLLNLTYHQRDVLKKLMEWKPALQLTASTLDEIASNLKDYLKADNKNLGEFLSEPEIEDIMESSLSPRDKTEKLRHFIHIKRYPVLSSTNASIKKTVDGLKLPKEIHLKWDKTLENKNLELSINVNDSRKWEKLLNKLSSPETKKALKSILEEL